MHLNRGFLIVVFGVFGVYSGWAMWQVGYFGIWQAGFDNPAALQILLDLVIAAVLICTWMIRDAARVNRNPWPYVALTLTAGSFGPLLYLILARRPESPPVTQASVA